MQSSSGKPISLTLFFCLAISSLFSQTNQQKVFLQISGGNTTYINPSTKTNTFAPGGEAFLIGSFNKNDSAKIEGCFLAGVTFTHSTEEYNVLWSTSNSNQPVRDNFFTNEFLFNVGGMRKNKLSKNISLNISLGIQFGPNYT